MVTEQWICVFVIFFAIVLEPLRLTEQKEKKGLTPNEKAECAKHETTGCTNQK